ncbi:Na+-transporting methylmalonyl-CoA/oxaloacetate decarboxylase gamma subunit [Corynebacterium afermentans]|uniref:hypothetical protein n=1 Tax=Corynebacterium afermentans TaxID=38286 RepID=UPI0025728516|nr:hypothetical protein [Corynebacterium afermentans]MCG7273802.1 hypothetical protein [Corynebacterium afermentans]MCG7291576.1 hypothetical protein [Corynebacterium afermentans]
MSNQRPLPPEIYMRRRVAALVILLVIVALLVWGLSAFARSGKTDETENTPETVSEAPSTTLATEPTVQLSEESTPSSTQPSEETVAAPVKKGSCELADLEIHASSNQPSYAIGVQPVFYMEVKNPTDTDCVINLDDNLLRFEVYDMATNDRIWSDTDCYPPVAAGNVEFAPGEKRRWEARWSVTASQPGQCDNRPEVKAGSYFLHGVIGDNASDASPFNIT